MATPPLPASRRWLAAAIDRRRVAVLVALALGGVLLRVLDRSPAETATTTAVSDARAQTAGAAAPPREPRAGSATGMTAASATFLPELPLQRDSDRGPSDAWPSLRAAAVAALLAGGLATLLWVRARVSRVGAPSGRYGAWLRWFGPARSSVPLEVVQSTRLTARASVHVLRWDGAEWLVGCAEQGVTVLGKREAGADAAGSRRTSSTGDSA